MIRNVVLPLLLLTNTCFAQKENSKWVFGGKAGLDFMISPPSVFTSSINSTATSASIADANGNLLFYTDGVTVYDKQHQIMANGYGLLGNKNSVQGALIIKKPASASLYFIFTQDHYSGPNGFQYSIVDMSLAAGNGSVVSKNNLIYTPSTDKLTGARHCNGEDFWVVTHEWNSDKFRAYVLSSSGLSNTPVISQTGSIHTGTVYNSYGQMKISRDGKKLGLVKYQVAELFDFDNSTGKVSNNLNLLNLSVNQALLGCEFSPDNKKFYVGGSSRLIQFDLSAATSSAIIASQFTLSTVTSEFLQLAIDGKIYLTSLFSTAALSVINQPNLPGAACGFTMSGQTISPNTIGGPPNMINLNYEPPPAFTNFNNCQLVTFSVSSNLQINHPCATYVGSTKWDFGDGSSAGSNTSTVLNPSHFYSAPGTYTAMLVVSYPSRADTIRQQVVVTGTSPSFSVSGKSSICAGNQTTLTASGSYSYSWSSGSTTNTVAVKPANTTTYNVTAKDGSCTTTKSYVVEVSPCLGINSESFDIGKVYPNPFGSTLNIVITEPCKVEILDINGKKVLSQFLSTGSSQLNTGEIAPGIYFVKVAGELAVWQNKFVKTEWN